VAVSLEFLAIRAQSNMFSLTVGLLVSKSVAFVGSPR